MGGGGGIYRSNFDALIFRIHCKQSETKISVQFILFINARPIPLNHKKSGCRSEKKRQKRYGFFFFDKIQVKGIESNLDKFHFPHRFWFLS